ncbi:hypothetical protein C2857_000485 [Epichloe festucae Fl1]|uniref:Acetylxylan esterase 2 n=1 Tax=Epichloe festucae (strain Fl1) TaxID=877507 RepID=A0A7S9PV15_EPIFF|nr:hypothetical protein C2857_000485 [Epichloe festucae Fl1]
MKHVLAPLALLAARATIPEPDAGDNVKDCADGGLYLISIRGTGEQPGVGVAGSILGTKVKEQVKGTKIVALDYPATFTSPSYPLSVGNGTKYLTELITDHVKACPNDKIAIMGYSQGAHVTLDTLCGTDETGFADTAAIASGNVENHIVAVALFGDPTHVANVTFNKGTSIKDGIFPRKNTDSCLKYANIVSSWCDMGDIYCDTGDVTATHGQYFMKYGTDIVNFIVDKAMIKSSGGSNTTSSASPTGTTTTTGYVQPSVSTTGGPATTTTNSTASAANGPHLASQGLFVSLPLALAAMFHML